MLNSRLQKINWEDAFSKSVYQRAHKYFINKNVLEYKTEWLQANELKILAEIEGKDDIYNAEIIIRDDKLLSIHGLCSCPVGYRCKHILATLLTYVSQLDSSQPDYLQNWLKNVVYNPASRIALNEHDPSFGLYYILHINQNYKVPEIKIEPLLIRHLKAGGLGSSKKYSFTSFAVQKHLDANDKMHIAQLETGKKLSQSFLSDCYALKTDFDEQNLLKILETKKCFWGKNFKKTLTLGLEIPIQFEWEKHSNGDHKLKLLLPHHQCRYFFIENLWYCDLEKHEIGLIKHDLPNHLLRSLLQIPNIKNEHIPLIQDFIQKEKLESYIHLPKQLHNIQLENIIPTPCLRIFTDYFEIKEYGYKDKVELIMAELTFSYEKNRIPWHFSSPKIENIEGDALIQIHRNQEIEKQALKLLEDCKIPWAKDTYDLPRNLRKFDHYYAIDFFPESHFEICQYVVPQLLERGWIVEYDENYPYRLAQNNEQWYTSIHEDENHDWFDIELGIEVEGKKVNLVPILQSFLRDYQLSELDAAGTVYLPIQENEFAPFETERLKPIIETLLHLNALRKSDGLELRLSKYHASRLLEIERAFGSTQLRWFGGDKLRDLGQKLANFAGISQVLPPQNFQAILRPYQQEGLNWLQFLREYELGGILADDMGLGKTIQTLAHICTEKESGRMKAPCLVIAPTSLMFNWQAEANKFAPHLKVLTLHGLHRKDLFGEVLKYDLILTTYPLIVRDKEFLLEHQFHALILDEAQCIKNAKTLTTQVALQIKSHYRLCLTGTPMENHLGELWSQFHFLMPGFLGDNKSFNKNFRHPIEKNNDNDCHQQLQKMIKPFMLRRTKAVVATELPEKIEMIRYVELSGKQRDMYETLRVSMHEKIQKEISRLGFARSQIVILDALLKLRQVCCDPRLIKNEKLKKSVESAKLNELLELTKVLIEEDRRILIFSQFTEMLSLIEDALKLENIQYLKLTGQSKNRQNLVESFQEGKIPIFLISLKAGGVGLNLTAADTVIHYDPWWNPAAENQATDRAYRIGQDKKVMVYKLVVKDTIEDKILLMQERKTKLINGLLEHQSEAGFGISEKDIKDLFSKM